LHLRDHGSFIRSSTLNPRTGELVKDFTHKGYSDSSTWGRAQAWGMLYTTMSYLCDPTQKRWLEWAIRGADWWLANSADI
jgi:unsaturated chondroitin disaccharide hydrolase